MDDDISFPFEELEEVESNVTKRFSCQKCGRPEKVCVCYTFPDAPIEISTTVHILQHPREQDMRLLTTVPLLRECIPKDKGIIYRGRRFPETKFKTLYDILRDSQNAALLYPSSDAVTVEEYARETNSEAIDLFVLDGTWREAKSIYYNCKFLHSMRKVKLAGHWKSEFVIKTQPNNDSVSTLEAVAIALGQIENKQELIEVARKPLKALCDFQINHGAQVHQSKEELAKLGIKYKCFDNRKDMIK
ncbi:tRNA-uridine aminocarboxypropyltransferase 2-like [Hydractinia symbiolongicarpus]|uniref:tRNA-uridine aminocarboxypropyltransferase 2-like n=1 Tax=Hydractinia symbiolongicarpus TaxID=13093 RepID=UPI0025516A33|nr:tRNA-uridine aminocarboxypropyltransferase 2-like [Hydractinia symbiolongicarpus]